MIIYGIIKDTPTSTLMATIQNKKEIQVQQEKLLTYKQRSILFGLIQWKEVVRTDILANDLWIFTNKTDINKLFIDGVEIDITKWKLSDNGISYK